MAASLRLKLPPPLPVLLVVCLTVASAAEAQRVAFRINGASPQIGVLDLGTYQSRDVSDDEAQIGALFTSDGQYAVRVVAAGTLSLRQMPTGQQVAIATDFVPAFAHPRRPVLFGTSAGTPARLDARGVIRWDVCGPQPPGSVRAQDLSLDGSRLFVACGADVVGIDTETGLEVSRLAGAGAAGWVAVNAAGTEVIAWRAVGVPAELVRIEIATGAVLASRTVSGLAFGWGVRPTPDHRRVVATSCRMVGPNVVCSPVIVDALSLADVRALPEGGLLGSGVHVSPDGREAVFNYAAATGAPASVATWLDVATGAVRAGVVMPPGETIEVNVQYPPLPPAPATVSVAAGAVSLSWQLPPESPAATGYRLEAGLAPGAAAVSIDLGAATSTTITGVPPGRYYARLRSVNYNGVGGASAELIIDVP